MSRGKEKANWSRSPSFYIAVVIGFLSPLVLRATFNFFAWPTRYFFPSMVLTAMLVASIAGMIRQRIRPRFSVRTLAIFVTLICVYFGAWELTKKYAAANPEATDGRLVRGFYSPLPFIICRETRLKGSSFRRRDYYFWLFGPEVDLKLDARHLLGGVLLIFTGYFVLEWIRPLSRRQSTLD